MISRTRQYLKEVKFAPVEKIIQLFVPRNKRAEWAIRYHEWKRSLSPILSEQLRGIVKRHSDARATIVFTPSLDWERQLFQRPQQLALALAKRGALVFYIQITHPSESDSLKSMEERLYVGSLPLEQLDALEPIFVYTLTWNRKYLLKFDQPYILYDYLDETTTFEGDIEQLNRDHQVLLHEADIITATAGQLYEDAIKTRSDAMLIPNGVNFEHFHTGHEIPAPPQDIFAICKEGKPIIGYYGAFASWFDYALVVDLVQKRVDLNFVLIGTKHDNSLESSGLQNQPNVHYLGAKPYSELPAYLAYFNVAILPFKVNRVTQSTSPIKLFEYFAGGKPVVSAPLREVMQYAEVHIGRDSQEFSSKIDEALLTSTNPDFVHRLKEIAQANTWEIRAEHILLAMEQKLAKRSAGEIESIQ